MGFRNALLLCKKCGVRLQHTYCSRLYPEIDMERWGCEWCLQEEKKKDHNNRAKRTKVFDFLLEIAHQSFPAGTSTSGSGTPEKRICRRDDRIPPEAKRFQIGTDSSREKASIGGLTKNNKALDRWKSLAKTKFGGCRRYKLLADVHC